MFTFPLQLPSGKIVRLAEISNRILFDIIKFCVANDIEGLHQLLEGEIFKKYSDLNIAEKLYIILHIRSFSLGFDISVTQVDGTTITYDIVNIVENLEKIPFCFEELIQVGDYNITVDIPSSLHFASPDEIYFDIIKNVSYDGITIDFKHITIAEKEKILEVLPPSLLPKLNDYIEKLNVAIGGIPLIDGGKVFKINEIKINLLSNQPIVFVQSIFSHDLTSFIQFMYQFVNKVGGTFKDFFDLTINDTKLMLDFYKEEIEKQNEELKKTQPRVK